MTPGEPQLSENALAVLRTRYLAKDETGRVVETPAELFRRVARNLVIIDVLYSGAVYDPAGRQPCPECVLADASPDAPSEAGRLAAARAAKARPLEPYTPFDLATLARAYISLARRGHMRVGWDELLGLLRERRPELGRREDELCSAMQSLDLLFNSPTLMNAGRELQQLSACFVLPVEDSLEGIFDTLKHTALIHQSGGGCVAGSTLVHTTFCGLEEIATLYRRARAAMVPESAGPGYRVLDVRGLGIETMAFDPTRGAFEPRRVTHLWRWEVPPADQVTVLCADGTRVTTSRWHPFLVAAADGIIERRADRLQPGDILIRADRSVRENWPIHAYRRVEGAALDEELGWTVGRRLAAADDRDDGDSRTQADLYLSAVTKSPMGVILAFLAGLVEGAGGPEAVFRRLGACADSSRTARRLRAVLCLAGLDPSGSGRGLAELVLPYIRDPGCRARLEDLARTMTVPGPRPLGPAVVRVAPAVRPEVFYDFTVEGLNNYLAGGFNLTVVHNTGFSFSRLRPKDDIVKSTGGVASGPVSFMQVFDAATNAIKQGGTRRGANMGILRCDHPDILDFINSKARNDAITNFNISVALTDAFMEAVRSDKEYDLINPRSGQKTGSLRAREVFNLIARRAWENGEPGVVFIDRINAANPTPHVGSIESTNPCGEQPLLPYESCNLASLNLAHMVTDGKVDYERLGRLIDLAMHYLDNVIDANLYPMEQIERLTKANRKVGLGVMGWADMLIQLGIPYDTEEAIGLAGEVMAFIDARSKRASAALARVRGPFPNFRGSIYDKPGQPPLRNATTTTIAPTGTISIVAGASGGIEPLFSLAFTRKGVLGGRTLVEMNPYFEAVARRRGFYSEELMAKVAELGSVAGLEEVPPDVRRLFVTALDIKPVWHVRMQAAFQAHTDNAVSKTVNLPFEATPEDIRAIYEMAYDLGCKGVTVYRNGSRESQVLNVGRPTGEGGGKAEGELRPVAAERPSGPAAAERPSGGAVQGLAVDRGPWGKVRPLPRPEGLSGITVRRMTPLGNLYLTLNTADGRPFELFAQLGKAGSDVAAFTEAVARLVSLALRCGIDPREIADELAGIGGHRSVGFGPNRVKSVPDAIARFLDDYLAGAIEVEPWVAGRTGQLTIFGGVLKEDAPEDVSGDVSEGSSREASEKASADAPGEAPTPGKTPPGPRRSYDLCPSCGMHGLAYEEGCLKCRSCGYSEC